MDLRRLRVGEWLTAASGVVLLLSLFLPWYGSEPPATDDVTGWQALAVIDIALALVAACGVLLAVVTATQRVPAVPIALSAVVTLVAIVGAALVVVRALDLPGGVEGREWGLWLGLAGTAGIVVGGLLGMADERLSPSGGHTDLTGRPVPPPPELETIPAPRP
jgi:hypothetical protein